MFDLITILGPTATGKTRLAAHLAKDLNGEIISADSRQVYRYMNLGTGKDLDDYIVEHSPVPYHLIDIIDPKEEYNLYHFVIDFSSAFTKTKEAGKIPFLVGGTGLYLDSIIQNYKLKETDFSSTRKKELELFSEQELLDLLNTAEPNQHNTTDQTDKARMIKAILIAESKNFALPEDQHPVKSLNIGIKLERSEIRKRITERLQKRLNEGMLDEIDTLLKQGVTYEKLVGFGLEYKYMSLFHQKKINYEEMFGQLNTAIHRFAKRQMTWFRKMEREGVKINWFEGNDYDLILNFIKGNY